MNLDERVAVVTGAASGIGEALAHRLAVAGVRGVALADIDEKNLARVCDAIGDQALAVPTDVADEGAIQALVGRTEAAFGPVDLFCSNAGISIIGGAEVPDDEWDRIWRVNVLAHIRAARVLLPSMLDRGSGYFLNTASAAGLLTQIGSAPYSVTKHSAVAFAEWLAVTHGADGIGVSVLCPQGVRTQMTAGLGSDGGVVGVDGMLEPDVVADEAIRAVTEERFLVLPHPEVERYFQHKANDYERWLRGMQKLQVQFVGMFDGVPGDA